MRNSRFKAMSLTDAAAERGKEIVAAADKPIVGVRVGVKNGGCAGMSYTMEFAEAVAAKRKGEAQAVEIDAVATEHAANRSGCKGREQLFEPFAIHVRVSLRRGPRARPA